MVKSLYSGVSGLKTHQQRMDVIGNNIANVNTIGNKTDVVVFKDVYYQTKRSPSAATSSLGGVNPRQVGYGVQMAATEANMTQSGYTQSDKVFDMAINGNGFFQVMDGSGNIFYTRAGNFNIDESGYLVNADGYHVLGISGDSEGQPAGSEIIRCVIPDTNDNCSSATKEINGTNVTLSVTAPSNNTNISVAFVDSNYPFATFANGILSIYFNRDAQYESEEDFEAAISLALQAGGITLPDDVELEFDFEEIPSDPLSKTAANSVDGLEFSTTSSFVTFHAEVQSPNGGASFHPYIAFSVDDNSITDTVTLVDGGATGVASVEYAEGTPGNWTVTIYDNTTASDINNAIKEYLKEHTDLPKFSLTSFIMPTVSGMTRADLIDAVIAGTNAINNSFEGNPKALQGVSGKDVASGAFDVVATESGAYANDYVIHFAYSSSYDNTKATWEENNLTITVCPNSTIADVNNAIKNAANGNTKKMLKFNDISGLQYGDGYDGSHATVDADGNVTTPATPKGDDEIWNPGIRNSYFGGNPSIKLTDGEDSFFTGVAKSLSTFALANGRFGSSQTYKDFTDVTVQKDGRIIGLHPVHGYIEIGRIDLATFDNPNGLAKVGNSLFQETVASGPAKVETPGANGAGEVLSGTLEMSNVDLADEFTNMITTQRGYQANSRVITVSDTMLEELLSLKR